MYKYRYYYIIIYFLWLLFVYRMYYICLRWKVGENGLAKKLQGLFSFVSVLYKIKLK